MPRTASEIEAEIAAAKAEGVHQASKRMKDLRAELKAVSAPTAPAAEAVTGAAVTWAAPTGEWKITAPDVAAPTPTDSDEWRFVERVLQTLQIEFGAGNTTGAVKRIFNEVDARVKVWRLLREIVTDIGVGAEWPQFSALNRDAATGRKVDPKPVAVRPALPQTPAIVGVTEGGMPIHPAAPARGELDAYKDAVRGSMAALVGAAPSQ